MFIILSSLECAAIFVLMFAIFRIKLSNYYDYISYSSIIIAILQYVFWKHLNLSSYAALLTVGTLILLLWGVFKFRLFYSILLTVVGFVVYNVFQTGYIFLGQALGFFDLQEAQTNQLLCYSLQLISIVTALLVKFIIERKTLWVTFFDEHSEKIKASHINCVMLLASIFIIVFIGIVFQINDVLMGLLLFSIAAMILIFLLRRKEIVD